jgi:hypothetical protein
MVFLVGLDGADQAIIAHVIQVPVTVQQGEHLSRAGLSQRPLIRPLLPT